MPASPLYQQLVLEHQRSPRHYGVLVDATHRADGANALCGDHLHVQARMEGDCIIAMSFTAEACAITTAAASMLGDCVTGKSQVELAQLENAFVAYLRGDSDDDASLGDLAALGELRRYPARRQCALLPFATLRAALAGIDTATTDKDSA